jgi:hypothetical protein
MKMNTVWAIVVVGIVAVLGIWYWTSHMGTGPALVGDTASSTPVSTMQTLSFNDLTLAYSSSEFALATTPEQVTVKSYIPPCDQGFNYCFFYKGSAYAGTNFESAGLRIQKRADLATAAACLSTPPSGYTNMKPVMASTTEYTLSTFTPLGEMPEPAIIPSGRCTAFPTVGIVMNSRHASALRSSATTPRALSANSPRLIRMP